MTLTGSYLLLPQLSAQIYWMFMAKMLLEFLEEIPWHLGEMWYQHDRAAAHFTCQFQKHLTATYNTHWIGQDWPVVWPARSPDLTPFYFFQ